MRSRLPLLALAVTALLGLAVAGAFYILQGNGDLVSPTSGGLSADTWLSAAKDNGVIQQPAGNPELPVSKKTSGLDVGALDGSAPVANPAAKSNARVEAAIAELTAVRMEKGRESAAEYASTNGLELKDDKVKVVVEAAGQGGRDSAAAAAVISADASIDTTYKNMIQAWVPLAAISQLVDDPAISYIREPKIPTTFTTSEGVADIGASQWKSAGYNGAGVKIAVLDPGFSSYQQLVAAGELPANVIATSFSGDITGGGEVHGAACAEIVYDTAPGAQLYLVNFSTDVELGNAVDYLISQGVSVVSASWGFYGAFRGDGQGDIDDLVQQANAAGIVWANASGNAAETHWSGNFTDTNSDSVHEFAGGDIGNDVTTSAGQNIDFYLTWDKWPLTDQDYDMYLYWSGDSSAPVTAGNSWQNGSQPPSEEIHYTVPSGRSGTYYIVIRNYSASGDATFQLYSYPDQFQYQVAAGSLGGQPADSAYAMTVGAVPAGGTTSENFSSRGPTVDGRLKPDISAPDRVSTVTYGSQGFWGTSAAAPHAAGAAALFKAANPTYTPAAIQAALESRATDLGTAGKDNTFGSGKLNLGALPDTTPPIVTGVQPTGMVYASSGSVVAYYLDSDSGINASSVQINIDGTVLSGCIVTTAQASCPFSGLTAGAHAIGGSVADNAGNTSPISGTFTLICGKPLLSLTAASTFWESYADYQARELSVTFTVTDSGGSGADNVAIVDSVNTNSALLASPAPITMGNITADGGTRSSTQVTVKYLVPLDVTAFRATVYLNADDSCGTTYSYPSPYSGT